jgi:hypothetical protein
MAVHSFADQVLRKVWHILPNVFGRETGTQLLANIHFVSESALPLLLLQERKKASFYS